MTREEFTVWVQELDPLNAEYILADGYIQRKFDSYTRWKDKNSVVTETLKRSGITDAAEIAKTCEQVAKDVMQDLEDEIKQYDGCHLTPANAKVGDGATVYLYSDQHAGTIVKVTKNSITVRRDKATLDPQFKPEIIPGGFCGHCVNQDEQRYTYEPNENGELTTVFWSKKHNCYGLPGHPQLGKGRHEFYDYNF